METVRLTVRLPKSDLEFAKQYAEAHGITVTELIDRYLRSLRSGSGAIHPEVERISHLPEMRPYSVGGDYDRPIARRIIEEAGVPRGAFARSKKGMALIFSWGPMFLSPPVREGFHRFLRENGLLLRTYGKHVAFHLCHLGFRSTRKVMERFKLQRPLGPTVQPGSSATFRSHQPSTVSVVLRRAGSQNADRTMNRASGTIQRAC